MAVFQGTRARSGLGHATPLPARRSRRTAPAPTSGLTRATARVRPTGLLMAAIMAATMLAMVYLTQTLGANATTSEIYQLNDERDALVTEVTRQQADVFNGTEPDAVIHKLRKLKLARLDAPVVLRAP
jgi:hypothetical protein